MAATDAGLNVTAAAIVVPVESAARDAIAVAGRDANGGLRPGIGIEAGLVSGLPWQRRSPSSRLRSFCRPPSCERWSLPALVSIAPTNGRCMAQRRRAPAGWGF